MRPADRLFAQVGLERDQRGAVEKFWRDAIGLELLGLPIGHVLAASAAKRLDPAAATQESLGPRVMCELEVLGAGGGEKRGHRARGGVLSRLRRRREITKDRRRDRGQRAIADISARIEIKRPARNVDRRARKHVRYYCFGLDDPCVAEACLSRRLAMAVDERHPPAARLKRERG